MYTEKPMGTRKRYDGTLLKYLPPFRVINPYIMRGRNESAIYYTQTIEKERTHQFLRDYNRDHERDGRLTLFHILLTGVVRTTDSQIKRGRTRRPRETCRKRADSAKPA